MTERRGGRRAAEGSGRRARSPTAETRGAVAYERHCGLSARARFAQRPWPSAPACAPFARPRGLRRELSALVRLASKPMGAGALRRAIQLIVAAASGWRSLRLLRVDTAGMARQAPQTAWASWPRRPPGAATTSALPTLTRNERAKGAEWPGAAEAQAQHPRARSQSCRLSRPPPLPSPALTPCCPGVSAAAAERPACTAPRSTPYRAQRHAGPSGRRLALSGGVAARLSDCEREHP